MADDEADKVTEDVGGVQGSETDEAKSDRTSAVPRIAADAPEQPAPDAGEIEWAGGLIRKPPAPEN